MTANVYIEHHFPKGYNPDQEPWCSIKKFHNAALTSERRETTRWVTEAHASAKALTAERQEHNDLREVCEVQLELIDAEREKYQSQRKELTDERQRRKQAEKDAEKWFEEAKGNNDSYEQCVSSKKKIKQHLLSALAAIEKLLRDDGHYIECPAPNQETHDFMPNSKDVQRCKALQSVDLSLLHEHDAEQFRKGWEAGNKAGLEVRKPLVDALEKLIKAVRANISIPRCHNDLVRALDEADALAKVKENA